jgi:hypothetical protein
MRRVCVLHRHLLLTQAVQANLIVSLSKDVPPRCNPSFVSSAPPCRRRLSVTPRRSLAASPCAGSRPETWRAYPRAGSAGAPARRRNWDSAPATRSRHRGGRTCIRRNTSWRRASPAANPCRSIRNWAQFKHHLSPRSANRLFHRFHMRTYQRIRCSPMRATLTKSPCVATCVAMIAMRIPTLRRRGRFQAAVDERV